MVTLKPQVAFLDINMPGVPVFQSIPSLAEPPLIVFQTAYSEHAATAFDINALDYLLKPVRFERLEKTVLKIRERIGSVAATSGAGEGGSSNAACQLSVSVNGVTRVVPIRDIARISFENGFCYLHTVESEKIISDKFLNHYEEKLQGARFFRASRTDIINLQYLASIRKLLPGMYTIELTNGMQVELSRRRAQALREVIDF
jgi:two-component system, LytTR family, response regulator